jgi:hypothetical protein
MKTNLVNTMILGLLAVMLSTAAGLAQDERSQFYTISGVVQDVATKKPIPFVSVYIPGAYIGTVTNLDGYFTLKVPEGLSATVFSISHLGYRTSEYSLAESRGGARVFALSPYSITLPEVIYQPDDARGIVEKAIAKIADNYPEEPQILTGFYRETIRQRRDYVSISEAVVSVYQTPYNHLGASDRVRIVQGRKSADVKKMDTLIVKLQGGPHVAMLLDIVKNPNVLLDNQSVDFYNYEFLDVVRIDNEANYVIGFEPRVVLPFPLYSGKLFISVEKTAITMAEFNLDISDRDKAAQNFIMKKPIRLRFIPTNTNYLVTYKEIDGRYQINYVRSELEFFADWRRRIFRTGYTVMSEMAITDRRQENVERFSTRESFRPGNVLADMVSVYFDEAFWGGYNVIEPDESIESAIHKLNRQLISN